MRRLFVFLAILLLLPLGAGSVRAAPKNEPARPDLAISVSAPDSPAPTSGPDVSVVVTVANVGNAHASGVTVTYDLPERHFGYGPETCGAGDPFSCDLGTIAAGESTSLTIRVRASASGTAAHSVWVSTTSRESDTTNNSARVNLTFFDLLADLQISRLAPVAPAGPGAGVASFDVTIHNAGPHVAEFPSIYWYAGAAVSKPLECNSDGLFYPGYYGYSWCGFDSIPPGESVTQRLTFAYSQPGYLDWVYVDAEVDSQTGDPDQNNNRAHATMRTVAGVPRL